MKDGDGGSHGRGTGSVHAPQPFGDRSNYSREQLAALRETLRAGEIPVCPECGGPLSVRPVERPEGVGYVRHRNWWLCHGCRRSAVLDTRQTGIGNPGPSRKDP